MAADTTADPLVGRSVIRITEAARALSLSATTIRRLIDRGKLDHVKIGKAVRVPVSAVRALAVPKAG